MLKYKARLLGAGLGAILLPACMVTPIRLVPESPAQPKPTASVRRVAPEPQQSTTSFAMVPRPDGAQMIPADPAQYPPMIGPNGEMLIPVQYVPVEQSQSPAKPMAPVRPMTTPSLPAQVVAAPTATEEPVELVAIRHTAEPPLASAVLKKEKLAVVATAPPAEAPRPLPPAVRDTPMTVPSGAQVLVLQPPTGDVKPTEFRTTEPAPAVLNLPAPPEELKMVNQSQRFGPNSPVVSALKAYQDKTPAEADKQLAHLDPVNQDLLRKLLPLSAKLAEAGTQSANPAEIAEIVEQLQHVVTTLRAKAALRIEKLSYCRPQSRSMRFGMVQPLPDDQAYRAGETVELYMELRNFSCEAKDREYTTHVSTILEIKDERGEVVSRFEFERDKLDVGAAPKQDYFHICRFPVQGLTPGQYTLTARATDVPTGKTAEKSLPLCIEQTKRTTARGTAD